MSLSNSYKVKQTYPYPRKKLKEKRMTMQFSINKTKAFTTAIILMLTISFALVAVPAVSGQAGPGLVMNLPGPDGVPHYVLFGTTPPYDIDLNGGPGGGQPIELWVKYPNDTAFVYHHTENTRSNGDLDYYDFDFNQTGDFLFKWRYPDPPNAESNVELARVLLVLPPSAIRQLLKDRWNDRVPTYVWVVPSPNPVGVGQAVSFIMMNPQVPHASSANNDVRWEYSIEIVAPDGTIEQLPGTSTTFLTQQEQHTLFIRLLKSATTVSPSHSMNYSTAGIRQAR
jgi:hypothetical protein